MILAPPYHYPGKKVNIRHKKGVFIAMLFKNCVEISGVAPFHFMCVVFLLSPKILGVPFFFFCSASPIIILEEKKGEIGRTRSHCPSI